MSAKDEKMDLGCEVRPCYKPGRWLGVWVISTHAGGLLRRKRVCVDHAAPDAKNAPWRLEEIPELAEAELKRQRKQKAAGRKALLADENRLPGDWPAPQRRRDA